MATKILAYINGKWVPAKTGGEFKVTNPATQELLATVTDCTELDVQDAISAASQAFNSWRDSSVGQRAALLTKIKQTMFARIDDLAVILSKENGKPLAESKAEIGFSAMFFDWFAAEARRQYGETIPAGPGGRTNIVFREPVGVAALITPWNFPIAMPARKVAAAIAAGCSCIIKPANETPIIAAEFVKLCESAGAPPGLINLVPCSRINVQQVGAALCQSSRVAALSFTGSTAVGKWLYERCAYTVKKLSLELGGNAPLIVFPSADLQLAVKGIMGSKFRNSGQTCVCANRIFVHSSIHDELVVLLGRAMDEQLKMGNPLDAGVTQGPLINERQLDRIHKLVLDSVDMGAEIIKGGAPAKGLFFTPTLITGITGPMPLMRDEQFGPVAAIIPFETEDEVIKLANNTDMGLAAYFYSNDLNQSLRVSRKLEAGMVGVNEIMISSPETPFGGYKHSGLGKEGSKYGLDEYTNMKLVCYNNNA